MTGEETLAIAAARFGIRCYAAVRNGFPINRLQQVIDNDEFCLVILDIAVEELKDDLAHK